MTQPTTDNNSQARAWIAMACVLAFVLMIGAGAASLALKGGPRTTMKGGAVNQPVPLPQPMQGFEIPDFTLTNQDGKQVDQTIFDGRYTILAFVFTNCPFACPTMTGNMIRLQDEFLSTPVKMVSISVDPVHDTPERLKEHASRFAEFAFWSFLTGDAATVQRICVQGLKLGLSEEANNPVRTSTGQMMNNIAHPSKLILIGPEREVLGMYPGLEEAGADALMQDLNRLLEKRPPRKREN